MNRRHLFKTIVGAFLAASIDLTGIAPRFPKAKINPEYLNAAYEDVVVYFSGFREHQILRVSRKPLAKASADTSLPIPDCACLVGSSETLDPIQGYAKVINERPSRYEFTNGEWVQIPCFVLET